MVRSSMLLARGCGLLLCAGTLVVGGCSSGGGFGLSMFGSGPGSFRIESTTNRTSLDASFNTGIYSYSDENTADLYFTDLTSEQIDALTLGGSIATVAPDGAQILHIHLFLTPRAGRTPIEFTASNVTLTHLVIAGDEVGVYGGGGFLLPSRVFTREPGSDRFGGDMKDATIRFLSGSAGFDDRLGSANVGGSMDARLDPAAAQRMATIVGVLSRAAGRF